MPDKVKLDLKRLGNTGLPVYGGMVFDEDLRDISGLRGRRIFREMAEQDPVIGGILLGVEFLARQVNWTLKPAESKDDQAVADGSVKPADPNAPADDPKADDKANEVADFIDEALSDMTPSFGATLSEILSMCIYGWSYLEILYKRREGINMQDQLKSSRYEDGKVGWGGWQIRSQETLLNWEFGVGANINPPLLSQNDPSFGPLSAMIQSGPPDFKEHRIPRSKALHFVTRSRRENPEGISLLRNAYRPWYMKKNIEVIEAIGVERDLAGLPVMWVPPELFSETASNEDKALFSLLQKIVTSIKRDEQEGILMPMAFDEDGKNPLYKLELLSTGGDRQFDTNGIIQRYDERIAMSMLADFILMGHAATGSYAMASTKTTLFGTAMSALLDIVAEEINAQAIPMLTVLNGWPLKLSPVLSHGKVDAADISKMADYLNQLNAAGMTIFPNPALEKFLLESAGMPGSEGVMDAGELPVDPVTGQVLDPKTGLPVDPRTGLPVPPTPDPLAPPPGAALGGKNPGKSPNNKTDVGARAQAPRDIAIRRETSRIQAGKKKPAQAASDEYRAKHFTPLPLRVAKLAEKLQSMMEPADYTELIVAVAEVGKFSKLSEQHQELILRAEVQHPVQA